MNIILVPIYTQTYRRSMILFHIYRWIINMLIDEMNATVFINFPWEENTHHWIFSEESRLRDVRLLCSVARNIHRCCSNLTVRRLICMTIYMQSITINHMHIYIYKFVVLYLAPFRRCQSAKAESERSFIQVRASASVTAHSCWSDPLIPWRQGKMPWLKIPHMIHQGWSTQIHDLKQTCSIFRIWKSMEEIWSSVIFPWLLYQTSPSLPAVFPKGRGISYGSACRNQLSASWPKILSSWRQRNWHDKSMAKDPIIPLLGRQLDRPPGRKWERGLKKACFVLQ